LIKYYLKQCVNNSRLNKQNKTDKLGIEKPPNMKNKQKKKGRPKTSTRVITKSSQEGTKDGYTRATFIVREDYLEKIKAQAYWERKEIKRVVEEILANHLKGKKIRPRPKEET
jgi:hypothetical protein